MTDTVDNNACFEARIGSNLTQWFCNCGPNDCHTGLFVTLEAEVGKNLLCSLKQSDATTGNDALFRCSASITDSILNAVLTFLQLNFSGRARLDDGNATGELGQTFRELFLVVLRVRVLDFCADLLDASLQRILVTATVNDGGFILGDNNLACGAK